MSKVQKALGQIVMRLQVSRGRRQTYRDLAQMAGTSERTMAEWMRGTTSPMAMNALLNLMSALESDDVIKVLALWRNSAPPNQTSADEAQHNRK